MSTTILLALGLTGSAMLAMAVGVIFKGRCLKGSCGGASGSCSCKERTS